MFCMPLLAIPLRLVVTKNVPRDEVLGTNSFKLGAGRAPCKGIGA